MPRRFRGLPIAVLPGGAVVPVASSLRSRLLGLAALPREGVPGLLIPRCRSVHTVGMRFELDVHFLDAQGLPVSVWHRVRPGRVAFERRARAVLEVPSASGGEG